MTAPVIKWKSNYQENDHKDSRSWDTSSRSTSFKRRRNYLHDKDIQSVLGRRRHPSENPKVWESIGLVGAAISTVKLIESQRRDTRKIHLFENAKTEEDIIDALSLSNFKEVVERLEYLREAVKEEGGTIEFQSLRNFSIFTQREHLPTPQIGIGPDGLVEAVWRSPRAGTLVLGFERSGDITFTVLYHQRTLEGRRQRISGELSQDRVMEYIGDFVRKLTAK